MPGTLGVEPMCRLAGVSRAGFYRFLQQRHPAEEDMEVRAAIHEIALEHRRRYGYRRIAVELGRCGMAVNRKRVARLMREDNLLALQPKAFVVTTQSEHELEVYLNLAWRMKLTAINQLWVADITYIRLRGEFVYLALVLDAFSRKVVGWELGRTLTARLALMALERAVAQRQPSPGLVHHSDRGVQYASAEYVGALGSYGIWPSMSRPPTPTTTRNARASSRLSSGRRSMPTGTRTWPISGPTSSSSSNSTTIVSGCTPRWAIVPRRSSKLQHNPKLSGREPA